VVRIRGDHREAVTGTSLGKLLFSAPKKEASVRKPVGTWPGASHSRPLSRDRTGATISLLVYEGSARRAMRPRDWKEQIDQIWKPYKVSPSPIRDTSRLGTILRK